MREVGRSRNSERAVGRQICSGSRKLRGSECGIPHASAAGLMGFGELLKLLVRVAVLVLVLVGAGPACGSGSTRIRMGRRVE